MILSKKRKIGAIMVIVGSFIYIPIGFIAIIGARNFLDKNIEIYYKRVDSDEEMKAFINTGAMEDREKESLIDELNKICAI